MVFGPRMSYFLELFLKASNYRKKYFTLTSNGRLFISTVLESLSYKTFAKIPSSCDDDMGVFCKPLWF